MLGSALEELTSMVKPLTLLTRVILLMLRRSVANAAGTGIYLNQRQIAPRDAFSISFGKVKIVGGIKWQASADSTVQAQMTGWQ
jgi:hypothetical protein